VHSGSNRSESFYGLERTTNFIKEEQDRLAVQLQHPNLTWVTFKFIKCLEEPPPYKLTVGGVASKEDFGVQDCFGAFIDDPGKVSLEFILISF
jgi:hypothetical protein